MEDLPMTSCSLKDVPAAFAMEPELGLECMHVHVGMNSTRRNVVTCAGLGLWTWLIMNVYLYIQKDKASIVGDTIAYVLELEKTLKHLQACKTSRQGYFRILKRKPSLAIVDDRDRPISCSPSAPSDYAAEVMKGPVCTRSEDSLQKRCKEREEAAISSSEEFSGDSSPQKPKGKEVPVIVSKSQVDVQHLGEQAVIKIVCARSPGLVLRVLQALEECKVEILQSNVTTVARNSVHFITVQISSGLSSSTEEMIQALHLASNPDQVAALI